MKLDWRISIKDYRWNNSTSASKAGIKVTRDLIRAGQLMKFSFLDFPGRLRSFWS